MMCLVNFITLWGRKLLGLREEGRWGREREGNGREKRRDEKRKEGRQWWAEWARRLLICSHWQQIRAHKSGTQISIIVLLNKTSTPIWFSVKTTMFSAKFISSISCILLHCMHHICCGEEDGWYLGNYHGGYCQLLESSSGLGGTTAGCHLGRWLCLPAVSHERKFWRQLHSNDTTFQGHQNHIHSWQYQDRHVPFYMWFHGRWATFHFLL